MSTARAVKGVRVAAVATGVVAALTLAGCGVPPSDVIEAGEPASGMFSPSPHPSAPTTVHLYFLHDGVPTALSRQVPDPEDVGTVVRLLFAGPTGSEAARVGTELPRLARTPDVVVAGDDTVSVQLPSGVPPLSHRAVLQLACTVGRLPSGPRPAATTPTPTPTRTTFALPHSRSYTGVHVIGSGWTMTQPSTACPDTAKD
ncbi:hypothetical protein AB0C59_34085 [Streptomyces sp. NPDC048664]|uniref:hypothetical protein n=1 Tax=Streptomyces sp. NPDC048664 TaxID=3154505 RepID=UPI003414026D